MKKDAHPCGAARHQEMNGKDVVIYFSLETRSNPIRGRPTQLYLQFKSHFSDTYEFYHVIQPPIPTHVVTIVAQKLSRILDKVLWKERNGDGNGDGNVLSGWAYVPAAFWGLYLPGWMTSNQLAVRFFKFSIRKALEKCDRNAHKRIAIVGGLYYEPYISRRDFDLICYDYMDDLLVYDPKSASVFTERHLKLIAKSDVVFVTAEKLKQEIASIAPDKKTVRVSNGADVAFILKKAQAQGIADYTKKGKRVVGFIGTIASWIDMDLIYDAAKRLRDVDFVIVGPFRDEMKVYIERKPENVFLLGPKEYSHIPAYISIIDVGIIPFKPGKVADATDPIKLYEYFALGKPVVAAHLKPLVRLDDGCLLKVTTSPQEFVEAISFFLTHDVEPWQARRHEIALQNSWHKKAAMILDTVRLLLDSKSTCA